MKSICEPCSRCRTKTIWIWRANKNRKAGGVYRCKACGQRNAKNFRTKLQANKKRHREYLQYQREYANNPIRKMYEGLRRVAKEASPAWPLAKAILKRPCFACGGASEKFHQPDPKQPGLLKPVCNFCYSILRKNTQSEQKKLVKFIRSFTHKNRIKELNDE